MNVPYATALLWALGLVSVDAAAAPNVVEVSSDEQGHRLLIDGEPTMLFGMNWGYMPVGKNYSYDFWGQPEPFVEAVLRKEMQMLRDMGVNSIRQYPGIPPRWVEWIYDNYGISTMINPLVGRYGTTVGGRFYVNTPYGDDKIREHLINETLAVVETYRDTRGVVMFLLGNEANYGLSWSSFEIQALPKEERDAARARHLYSLYGEIIDRIHAVDTNHPVAICNGDLQYIDLIAELAPNMDIMASNVYRGISARDLYEVVEEKLGVPFVYSEFGSDAYNARLDREDPLMQARYLHGQWQEIYEQSHGKGKVGNAIGGYIFQWADGWWKYKQEENLDVHDTNASWPNRAYPEDFVEGGNNMNEEWFGINAKTPPDPSGMYALQPRTAYWMLADAFRLDPYAPTTDLDAIRGHFEAIRPADYSFRYDAVKASARLESQKARVRNVRLDLGSFLAGGSEMNGRGDLNTSFDHGQSLTVDVEATPVESFVASASVNVLGNVPSNRIDPIFFENRGSRTELEQPFPGIDLANTERTKLYHADFTWNHRDFDLEGYYRVGHYHWGYEGDFFGFYREANYGPNVDMYNADVPIGMVFSGKRGVISGLKIAFGPQIYWGANPTLIAKYTRSHGPVTWALLHQEDLAPLPIGQNVSTVIIAEQMIRRTAAYVGLSRSESLVLEAGGLWAGSNKVGQTFTRVEEASGRGPSYGESGYHVIDDVVRPVDALGGKAKVTVKAGPLAWYAQGARKGVVADGGPDETTTITGWRLKESGRGNQTSVLSGAAFRAGYFEIAPQGLYQKPLVGPNPLIDDSYDPVSRVYTPAVLPRNVQGDPFAVLDNRETLAAELLLTFDPTPGSWFYQWDNETREDAGFAASLDIIYRRLPTSRDANFGFTADGILFAFAGAPPPEDLWDGSARMVFGLPLDSKLVVQAYAGESQANGDDDRVVFRKGANTRLWVRSVLWDTWVKLDDYGPYDFHRDFNLTYPFQLISDLSAGLGRPKLVEPTTRIGTLVKYRTLDRFSPNVALPLSMQPGFEFEVGTYVRVSL